MSDAMPPEALILLAHGSPDPHWQAPFKRLAEALAPRMTIPLRLAFMELCPPSLETTTAELVDAGLTRIDILPLFFAAGRHLRKDVPGQVANLLDAHPGLDLRLLPPVGKHPAFVEALAAVIADQAGEPASPRA